MATLKELRELSAKALEKHHQYERRIKAVLEKRKETCPHEKTKIVDQDYFEHGRMSHAIRWQELVCCRCKKVLATRGERSKMSEWSTEEGVTLPEHIAPVAKEHEHTLEVTVREPVPDGSQKELPAETTKPAPGTPKPGTIRIVKRADAERGQ